MTTQGRITCPECKAVSTSTVPEDACTFFFECPRCKTCDRRAGEGEE